MTRELIQEKRAYAQSQYLEASGLYDRARKPIKKEIYRVAKIRFDERIKLCNELLYLVEKV